MQMIHLLSTLPPVVDLHLEAVLQTLLTRQGAAQRHQVPQQFRVLGTVVKIDDVLLRNDEEVHRGRRIDVMEDHDLVVFMDLASRDLAVGNLAEDAVGVIGLGRCGDLIVHERLHDSE